MSGVSHTSADEYRPKGGADNNTTGTVVGKFAHAWSIVHFADLIHYCCVDPAAHERRQGYQTVHVTRSEEEVLISTHLIGSIGKKTGYSAEVILRNSGLLVAHGRPTLSHQKEGI